MGWHRGGAYESQLLFLVLLELTDAVRQRGNGGVAAVGCAGAVGSKGALDLVDLLGARAEIFSDPLAFDVVVLLRGLPPQEGGKRAGVPALGDSAVEGGSGQLTLKGDGRRDPTTESMGAEQQERLMAGEGSRARRDGTCESSCTPPPASAAARGVRRAASTPKAGEMQWTTCPETKPLDPCRLACV